MPAKPRLDGFICPLCFTRSSARAIPAERPLCPDCESEAMEIEVIPVRKFLADTSLDELLKLREKWSASTEFLETYRVAKLERMSQVIEWKRRLDDGAKS